jgi:tetratricopeptide (TPR) repeat protein
VTREYSGVPSELVSVWGERSVMSPTPGRGASNARGRRCAQCDKPLASDNSTLMCGRCLRDFGGLDKPPAGLTMEFFLTEEMSAAFDSEDIGEIFKAYRRHERFTKLLGRPLSQEEFGRWLRLSQTAVSRIEKLKPEQTLSALREYAKALHLPKELLWFDFPGEKRADIVQAKYEQSKQVRSAESEWLESSYEFAIQGYRESTDVTFVRLAAQESANYGLRHPVAELHFETLEQIAEEVRKLSSDFISKDPLETFNRSRRLRNDIFILLERKHLPWQEQLLYAFGARTLGYLAGASSDFYGLYDAAADHLRLARQFADASGSSEVHSWVLSLQSANTFWMNEWAKAATFSERALNLAVTRSGFLRATSMRARALARLGDVEGLNLVVRHSEDNPVDGKTDDEQGMILFSESNHLRCVGTAYLWVGEYSRASEQLQQALDRYLSDSPENFAVIATIRADIATSYVHQGDIQAAMSAVAPLLELSPSYRLEGAVRRLRALKAPLADRSLGQSSQAGELLSSISTFVDGAAPKPESEAN